ncbi:MAG: cytochrome c oxidase accessory protein CcoG [Deltaproteobacteria bacterium]|nr:cytochrome c oxidase accessory protein CcoG [Deltaproteobacteria bacterium]
MTTAALPESEERVLSTLNADGSRRWLRPRLSPGRFLSARRILAWILIAVFTLLPYLRINGKPAILLDILHRRFTLFGTTFLPTDTVLLALLVIGLVVSIFFVTAVFGRVWCGYACPQTVYMEFVYRPLERLFDGPPRAGGRPGRKQTGLRTAVKYAVFLVVSMYLAHTFLAYFVGVEALRQWIFASPFEHPTSFLVMAATTGLMLFDFAYFREQTCIVACPYGRLQSVLVDRDSLIISYDPKRGEPRGRGRRDAGVALGDCVDCYLCVETCPTGIDIRDGLRMECVGCAQCIDACDAVMERIGRPRGLIRYGSQATIAGEAGRVARPRIFIYSTVLLVITALFIVALSRKGVVDVTLLRGLGAPFVELPNGEISNPVRVKIMNRLDQPASFRVEVGAGTPARLEIDEDPMMVPAGTAVTKGFLVLTPASVFTNGKRDIVVRVTGAGETKELNYRLLGPITVGGREPQ